MLLDAFVVAALAGVSVVYLSDRMPPKLKEFFKKNRSVSDLLAFLAAYTFLGGTVTALMAGLMLIGILESIIHVANNPDDFLYLWDIKRSLEEKLGSLKGELQEFGQDYKSRMKVVEGGLSR